VSKTVEETDQRKARSEAIDQATDAVTVEMVKSQIGEARFNGNAKKWTLKSSH
jgi:ribosomal protein S24E